MKSLEYWLSNEYFGSFKALCFITELIPPVVRSITNNAICEGRQNDYIKMKDAWRVFKRTRIYKFSRMDVRFCVV